MKTAIASSKTLDDRGKACSEILADIKNTLSEMTAGQVLEVLTTDSCTEYDLPNWVSRTGGKDLLDTEHVTIFHIKKL